MRRFALGVLLAAGLACMAVGEAAAKARRNSAPMVRGLTAASFASVRGPTSGPAQSIGGYAAGCLAGGQQLPPEGLGYQAIRLSRNRNYGHPILIDFIKSFGQRVAAAHLGTALIADMTQPRGGPMTFSHASHMIGLDADVWLRLDLPAMDRVSRESLHEINFVDYDNGDVRRGVWTPAQADMIRLAASDSRVARIFVNPTIKKALCERAWTERSWLRKVRPWYGHDGHMHIRLACPPGNSQCVPQRELPDGDGCDDDLDNWIASANHPIVETPPDEAKPPHPVLPVACRSVLSNSRPTLASAFR